MENSIKTERKREREREITSYLTFTEDYFKKSRESFTRFPLYASFYHHYCTRHAAGPTSCPLPTAVTKTRNSISE